MSSTLDVPFTVTCSPAGGLRLEHDCSAREPYEQVRLRMRIVACLRNSHASVKCNSYHDVESRSDPWGLAGAAGAALGTAFRGKRQPVDPG